MATGSVMATFFGLRGDEMDLTKELWAEVERLNSVLREWQIQAIDAETESARLAAENEKLRTALQEAFEVYAGSDGFIPETAAEGYQQQVIKQIINCINAGLAALQDKSDE